MHFELVTVAANISSRAFLESLLCHTGTLRVCDVICGNDIAALATGVDVIPGALAQSAALGH